MQGDSEETRRFVQASAAFMLWVDTYDCDRSDLADVHMLIADLQGALLRLPRGDDDEEEEGESHGSDADDDAENESDSEADSEEIRKHGERWAGLIQRLSPLPVTHYRVVFDALEGDDADNLVTGWLADDLSSIYLDLKTGLDELQAGRVEDAIWEWRFGYFMHWGRHATHAQSAILDYLRLNAAY
jgi:hypothetical protein